MKLKLILVVFISILADFLLKFVVIKAVEFDSIIKVIGNFFSITYVKNYGAAWNIFEDKRLLLIGITFAALMLFIKVFVNENKMGKYDYLYFGTLIGGILGNLIDRLYYGFVIDYLRFDFGSYTFPIFNLADVFISVSSVLLIIKILREEKNEKSNSK